MKRLLLYSLALIGFVAVFFIVVLVVNARYYSAKFDGGFVAVDGVYSSHFIHKPQPIWQDEPHTCGYLAISALYRSYSLDPAEHRIRFRLGTDARANILDYTSVGTIHPDIYRVLYQDGFTIRDLDLADPRYVAHLHAHCYDKHLALVLLKRPQTGNLHWVLVTEPPGPGADDILVVDSLAEQPYQVMTKDFLDRYGVSVFLVFRPTTTEDIDAATLNAMGMASVAHALKRM